MPIKLWREESDGSLSSQIWTVWDSPLGGEEYRIPAEELDSRLDNVLDDALVRLAACENVNASQEFKRSWSVGRTVRQSGILQHSALVAERRMLLWRAMAWKCWLGARHDYPRSPRETRWRGLRPSVQPENKNPSRMLDVFETGFWLQQQELKDAAFTFGGNISNAEQFAKRKSINAPAMRVALTSWLQSLPEDDRRKALTSKNFKQITQAMTKRWPDRGFGSARRPEHTNSEVLLAEVTETLFPVLDEIMNSPAKVPLSPTVS